MHETPAPARRLSALQKQILTVLAALDECRPSPVPSRDIERLLTNAVGKPVYGGNLRQSCRRLETGGLVRTLRAQNLQLLIEMTDAGRDQASPLLDAERQADAERQRAADVRVLPVRPAPATLADIELDIDGQTYTACRGAYVVRLDGTTCLQLWSAGGRREQLTGDAVQVADWYQHCYDTGGMRTTNNLMVLTKGHELTDTAISALKRLLAANAVKEPIRVRGRQDAAASQ